MRPKILFDKTKLFSLTDKLDNTQRGVFFSLLRYLFTDKQNAHVLMDGGKPLSVNQTVSLIAFYADCDLDRAKAMFDALRSSGVLAVPDAQADNRPKDQPRVICPLIEEQMRVSASKVRKPKIAQQIKQKEPAQVQVRASDAPEQNTGQDQISTLFALQGDETSVNKRIAVEIIGRLNTVSGKKRGFTTKPVNINPIIARLRDGFKRQELEMVVDYMTKKWKDTESEFYLRPVTLFREKNFESYLHEAEKKYQAQKSDHPISRYIQKYFKRVSEINIQMSDQECEKISRMIDWSTTVKYLTQLENSRYLGNSVYLSLIEKINRDKPKQDTAIVKSNAT